MKLSAHQHFHSSIQQKVRAKISRRLVRGKFGANLKTSATFCLSNFSESTIIFSLDFKLFHVNSHFSAQTFLSETFTNTNFFKLFTESATKGFRDDRKIFTQTQQVAKLPTTDFATSSTDFFTNSASCKTSTATADSPQTFHRKSSRRRPRISPKSFQTSHGVGCKNFVRSRVNFSPSSASCNFFLGVNCKTSTAQSCKLPSRIFSTSTTNFFTNFLRRELLSQTSLMLQKLFPELTTKFREVDK